MSIALDALIFVTGWIHVAVAPYTKVEESFNLHAVHDVLMHGVRSTNLAKYDHFVFPGAVPRTFIGSVLLAWLTGPFIKIAALLGYLSTKFEMQVLARLVLASVNAWMLCLIRRSTRRRFGATTSFLFVLFTCSQFHYPFWMGRTIPNMFATIPINYAIYTLADRWVEGRRPTKISIYSAVSLVAFAGVIFRAELALLLGALSIHLLASERIGFNKLVQVGLRAVYASIGITLLVDSYFWDRSLMWPELFGVYFNVIQGKSADWGTSPIYTYIISYLPKLLLGALPLSILGFLVDPRIQNMLWPSIGFIPLISLLGHKEWRFIVYVVPPFNVAAARGGGILLETFTRGWSRRLTQLILFGIFFMNFFVTILFTKASTHNYPGGEALYMFHQLYSIDTYPTPHLHISNLAAQTGASLFLQLNSPPYPSYIPSSQQLTWTYNKTESLTPKDLSSSASSITHIISEISPESDRFLDAQWHTVAVVRGFDRWTVDWELLRGRGRGSGKSCVERLAGLLYMQDSEKLWILERNGFQRIDF